MPPGAGGNPDAGRVVIGVSDAPRFRGAPVHREQVRKKSGSRSVLADGVEVGQQFWRQVDGDLGATHGTTRLNSTIQTQGLDSQVARSPLI